MSRIRSKNTKIELQLEQMLKDNKISFIKHPKIHGSPDFLIRKRTLVFCDGDFWHGYDYENGRVPPQKFWREKIECNMRRDRRLSRTLRRKGWSVIRLWEHDIKKRPEFCIKKLKRFMK